MISLWGFVAVTLPLVATPGASTAIVLRNSIAGGARAGLLTALGCNAGSLCYGLLSAFGFAVALQRWPSAWLLLRVAGVACLAWLGLVSLAVRRDPERVREGSPPEQETWRSVSSGFLTNLLNPSLAAFYLIVMPQFIPRGAPFAQSAMALTAVHISMAVAWHVSWAFAGASMARTLSSGAPRRALDTISGIALLALAIKVALG
ncbi:MAG TPA: LysE family translocator [Vicinamibacterales bacterium]|nr:LysE family translocator [Vicinamibacterales bacterium]